MKKQAIRKLNSFYVIPGHTFFYWGFTLPKREYEDFDTHFDFSDKRLTYDIELTISAKKYPAKIRQVRITTDKFPNRKVVQVVYEGYPQTLKALRKLFIYSYAATINKEKPALKELLEFIHVKENVFRIKPISRQKTDFDSMLYFLEDKNLFEYLKNSKSGKEKNFFIDFARSWIPISRLSEFKNRANVIYILFNSRENQIYVGKANKFGSRVKEGIGRIGLASDWDRFMYFEIDPEYNAFITQIEAYTIRTLASVFTNDVGTSPLVTKKRPKLVNRQLMRK